MICAQRVVGSNPRKVDGGGKNASDLNSLLGSNKVSLLTREQTLSPHTRINNVEYKCKKKNSSNSLISLGVQDTHLVSLPI